MKIENYSILWDATYLKAGKEIFDSFSPYVETGKLEWDHSEDMKEKIWRRYNYYRRIFHTDFFYGQSEEGRFIDIHKICACFARAIVDMSPISFPVIDTLPWFIKTSNYVLAYYTSIHMLHFFLTAHYKYSNKDYYDRVKNLRNFSYPETTIGHDTYSAGRIKAMALNDINNVSFDLLAYADMMFWIEHYNRQIVENKVILQPVDPGKEKK